MKKVNYLLGIGMLVVATSCGSNEEPKMEENNVEVEMEAGDETMTNSSSEDDTESEEMNAGREAEKKVQATEPKSTSETTAPRQSKETQSKLDGSMQSLSDKAESDAKVQERQTTGKDSERMMKGIE